MKDSNSNNNHARGTGKKRSVSKLVAVIIGISATRGAFYTNTTPQIATADQPILAESGTRHSSTKDEREIGCPDSDLTWLDDLDRSASNKKIPNILYQTAKGHCVQTDVFNATILKWLNSSEYSLGYRFYDDPRMDEYLFNETKWKSIFPGLSLALNCIAHAQLPVMKADIWRYLILWERGGIFADLDVVLDTEKSLLQQLKEHDDDAIFVMVNSPQTGSQVLSQWFFAVAPRHPLMYYAAERAISLVLHARRAIPIQHTGPRALYEATDRFLLGQGSELSRHLKVNQVYSEVLDPEVDTRHPFSFRVAPSSWAENLSFPEGKKRLYDLMNMTHYRNNKKGKKAYGNGSTCLEFQGGMFVEDRQGFTYKGETHTFHNPMPPPLGYE